MERIQKYINNCPNKNEIYLETMDLFFEGLDEESLWNMFQQRVNPEYSASVHELQNIDHVCDRCNTPMLTNEVESYAVCSNCGLTKAIMIMLVNYKYKRWEFTGYPYKRITHFRKHLKKLDRNVDVSRELQETLERMFKSIQSPFNRHKPQSRKNFLNYSYIIKKLLELNNNHEASTSLRYLKSKNKLRAHDKIWKGICDELGWTFSPSIKPITVTQPISVT